MLTFVYSDRGQIAPIELKELLRLHLIDFETPRMKAKRELREKIKGLSFKRNRSQRRRMAWV